MSIVFYVAPMSSAAPVACALAELGVPHERVVVDLKAGDPRKPEFLALNPNGQVPTLVVDGTPMFEALAINLWLADRYGVEKGLWPAADAPARCEALAWSTWAYVSFGSALTRLFYVSGDRLGPEYRHALHEQRARADLDRLLGVLGGRLEQRSYVLGDAYSMADLILASTVAFAASVGLSLADHPAVRGWLERCTSRPSFQSTMSG